MNNHFSLESLDIPENNQNNNEKKPDDFKTKMNSLMEKLDIKLKLVKQCSQLNLDENENSKKDNKLNINDNNSKKYFNGFSYLEKLKNNKIDEKQKNKSEINNYNEWDNIINSSSDLNNNNSINLNINIINYGMDNKNKSNNKNIKCDSNTDIDLYNSFFKNVIDLENARESNKREMVKVASEAKSNLLKIEGEMKANLNKIENERIDIQEKNKIELQKIQKELNMINIQKIKVLEEAVLMKRKEENRFNLESQKLKNENNIKEYYHLEEMEKYKNKLKINEDNNKNKENLKRIDNNLKEKELENKILIRKLEGEEKNIKSNNELRAKEMDINKLEMELKYKKDSVELNNKFKLDLKDKNMEFQKEKYQFEKENKEKENKIKIEYILNLIKNIKDLKLDNSDLQLLQMIQTNNSDPNQKEINHQSQPLQSQIYNRQMVNPLQQMNYPQMMYPPQQIYYPQMIYPPQPMYYYQQQQFATPGNPNINNSQMNYNSNIPK